VGCLMDEELAVGSSPESGGEWLSMWVETGDEWCPQGLVLGLILLNIFISDTEWDRVPHPCQGLAGGALSTGGAVGVPVHCRGLDWVAFGVPSNSNGSVML